MANSTMLTTSNNDNARSNDRRTVYVEKTSRFTNHWPGEIQQGT